MSVQGAWKVLVGVQGVCNEVMGVQCKQYRGEKHGNKCARGVQGTYGCARGVQGSFGCAMKLWVCKGRAMQ